MNKLTLSRTAYQRLPQPEPISPLDPFAANPPPQTQPQPRDSLGSLTSDDFFSAIYLDGMIGPTQPLRVVKKTRRSRSMVSAPSSPLSFVFAEMGSPDPLDTISPLFLAMPITPTVPGVSPPESPTAPVYIEPAPTTPIQRYSEPVDRAPMTPTRAPSKAAQILGAGREPASKQLPIGTLLEIERFFGNVPREGKGRRGKHTGQTKHAGKAKEVKDAERLLGSFLEMGRRARGVPEPRVQPLGDEKSLSRRIPHQPFSRPIGHDKPLPPLSRLDEPPTRPKKRPPPLIFTSERARYLPIVLTDSPVSPDFKPYVKPTTQRPDLRPLQHATSDSSEDEQVSFFEPLTPTDSRQFGAKGWLKRVVGKV